MKYYIAKTVDYSFDAAIEKVTAELKKEGFGILTEIDVKSTLKNKINVDFRKYAILGACNPHYAYKAFMSEDKIGVVLPCNVIVQELDNNKVEVAAIDPLAMMEGIGNPALTDISHEVKAKLTNVIESL